MSKYRVTLWIEEDNLVLSFDHPYANKEWFKEFPEELSEFDTTDMDDKRITGLMEYMGQSDSWSGMFYDHDTVTRIRVAREDT